MNTCVIIGGGLGGLVTGALLAKEGYQVTVLEKNAIIGGGLQTFKRNGVSFPTGMHIFGGFQEGGRLRKLFEYLGIMDKLSLQPMDDDGFDVVSVLSDGAVYRLPKGKERFVTYLSERFPDEKASLEAYYDKLFELSKEEPLFYLQETPSFSLPSFSEDFIKPYDALMDQYISNPKLKGLLTYLNPLFDGETETTPAFLQALLSVLHLGGTFQFVGGSQQMAQALTEVIENAGGQVLANDGVVKIDVEDGHVTQVVTKKGKVYRADTYISAVHTDVLLRIISPNAFSTAFKQRVMSIPETFSSFKVYVKFKEKSFRYVNHARYCLNDYDSMTKLRKVQPEEWPNGLMYITPPEADQDEYAQSMVIICSMSYEWVRQWENTTTGHRGVDYEQWKQAMTDKVLDFMEKFHPDFRQSIDKVYASSPLTIRDYYGNKEGSNYGFKKESNDILRSQMSVFTKVKNLFLTGQNVNIHGLCGVSLTAIETAEALVGHNVIVHKINEANVGRDKE